MGSSFFDNPLVQSALLPLALSFGAALVLRLIFGGHWGRRLAAAGIGVGFLGAYWAILGVPNWPPVASTHKLAYVVAGAIVAGLLFERLRDRLPETLGRAVVAFGGAALVAGWLGWSRLKGFNLDAAAVNFAVLVLVGGLLVWRLDRVAVPAAGAPVMLLAAALGLGAVALISNSASLGQLGFGLAAAVGGFLLLNWPKARWPLSGAGALAGGLTLVALVAQVVFFTRAPNWPLLLLVPVFFADLAVRRLPLGTGPVGRALEPVVLGLLALIPVAAAAFAANVAAGASQSLY